MAMSGISVSTELKSQLIAVQEDTSLFCVEVAIQSASSCFQKKSTANMQGSTAENFQAMSDLLDNKTPSYVFFRSPREEGKWVFMFYCPSSALVRHRMVYAASKQALKNGFGASLCVDADYHATDKSETTAQEYLSTFDDYDPTQLMTHDEIERNAAEKESHMTAGRGPTKISADIPVNIDDEVITALRGFQSGEFNCVVLDINTKTETITHDHSGNESGLDELLPHMQDRTARYILFKHNYTHEEQKICQTLFFFFCHERCKPRSKMIYATVKSKVMALCRDVEISNMKVFEMSDTSDLSDQNIYLDLHPPVVTEKTFTKPKAKGKGKRRMHGKVKFKR